MADQVWAALSRDDKFVEMFKTNQEVLKPFVMAMPSIFLKRLEEPLTVELLLWASFRFWRYCIGKNLAVVVAQAVSDDVLDGQTREEFEIMVREELAAALARKVNGARARKYLNVAVDDEAELMSQKIGLNKKSKKLYRHGRLTLRELILRQPIIIIDS